MVNDNIIKAKAIGTAMDVNDFHRINITPNDCKKITTNAIAR